MPRSPFDPLNLVPSPDGPSETRMRTSRVLTASPIPDVSVSGEHYRALTENSSDAVLVLEPDSGRFVDTNPAARQLFLCSEPELLVAKFGGLFMPACEVIAADMLAELSVASRTERARLQFQRRDSTSFVGDITLVAFRASGRSLCMVVIRDVSQAVRRERELELANESLREAQSQLVHFSKLAAIGELAAGVAHEVNNPAAFVSVYLTEVRQEIGNVQGRIEDLRAKFSNNSNALIALEALTNDGRPLSELHEMLGDSIDGVQRIASTVKELRAFSRVEREDAEVVDLNEIVRTACKICQTQIRYRARLELSLEAVHTLVGSRTRLIQVLTNLLTNAAQAIEEGEPEQQMIRVTTSDEAEAVCITVEDTGTGIDAATRAQLFQPFFTTKSRDAGTGLGLALCANILRDHLGEISVQSQPGGPTCFTVRLPFDTGLVPSWTKLPRPAPKKTRLRRKLLIIDDEVHLLRAYQRALGRYHDVETATGGKEGLERLLANPDVDLIICDLMMPGVDGVAVHAGLSAQAPHLVDRLAFSTGGVFTARGREFLSCLKNPHLQKPLELEAIEELLARLPPV